MTELMLQDRENHGEIQMISLELKEVGLTIHGQSIAGTRTSLIIPQFGICLDFGFCSLLGTQQKLVLVTHSHADHIGSLHLHVFERRLHRLDPPTLVMPGVCVPKFNEIFQAFRSLEGANGARSSSKFEPLGVGLDRLNQDLVATPKGRYWVRAYRMRHRVPALGYLIVEKRKKLKEEYFHLKEKPQEIASMVKSGIEVSTVTEIPQLAYTGDTTFQGVLENPIFFQAEVLIMECTYLGVEEDDTPKEAKKRGHIHIQDLEDHLYKFQNKVIVLCHFSRMYRRQQVLDRVEELNQKFGNCLEVYAFI